MRIIDTDTPAKNRRHHLRTFAEMLYRLKKSNGDEAILDMGAYTCAALKSMAQDVHTTCVSWDERGYYMKSEKFRQRYSWISELHEEFEDALSDETPDSIIDAFMSLYPYVSDISVKRLTRPPSLWRGAYRVTSDK